MTDSWRDRFIGSLRGLHQRDDRAALATLRRAHGGETPYEAYRYLPADLRPWEEEAALLIASLFALHPGEGGRGTLGTAFRRMLEKTDSVEGRFMALLNSHVDDLPNHLRQAVSLLKSKEVPIDWRKLLDDILLWDHPKHCIQKRWARNFWVGGKEASSGT